MVDSWVDREGVVKSLEGRPTDRSPWFIRKTLELNTKSHRQRDEGWGAVNSSTGFTRQTGPTHTRRFFSLFRQNFSDLK